MITIFLVTYLAALFNIITYGSIFGQYIKCKLFVK